jgi:hypothetical protein
MKRSILSYSKDAFQKVDYLCKKEVTMMMITIKVEDHEVVSIKVERGQQKVDKVIKKTVIEFKMLSRYLMIIYK